MEEKRVVKIARGVHERLDWSVIRAEYVAGGTSYRKLSRKYGVSATSIGKRSRAEGWPKDQEEARRRSCQEVIRKTADIAAENAVRAQRIKTRLLDQIEGLLGKIQLAATEERAYDPGGNLKEINRIRDLTAAYKDLTGDMPQPSAGEETLQQAREILGGVDSVIK